MLSIVRGQFFSQVIRWAIALTLAVAAGLKLGRHAPAETMFGGLPAWGQLALVIVELVLAAWIVSEVGRRASAFVAIALFSGFLCVLALELMKPVPRPCGCFGQPLVFATDMAAARMVLWQSVVVDGVLLVGAVVAYFGPGESVPMTRVMAGEAAHQGD